MRKWQYIVKALRIKKAPKKVINAAREIDLALIVLGFNSFEWRSYKDGIFARDENWKDINDIVYDRDNCPTCCDCDHNCECCRLGDQEHCTPRSKHADDYFTIVSNYIHNKMREACIIIDWQQPKEHIATEIEELGFGENGMCRGKKN